MKNKIELKKAIITSICIIFISNIIFAIIEYKQYKIYTNKFNQKISNIIEKLEKEYPNIDKNDLMMILNYKTSGNKDTWKQYGIDIENDTIVFENDKYFKYFLILNSIVLTAIGLAVLVVFIKYNYLKDMKLKEITNYIEKINNKIYTLDIDDNTEDELSILKNEIYKTTIMLKEIAENSKQAKISLKESLSDISHQLKTPLTSIIITLDNILDDSEMEKEIRNGFIKDIKREVMNLNFLVNSLLKLSKLDADSIKFINNNEKIEEIVNESVKKVSALSDLRDINIEINGNSQSKIYCDLKWQIEAVTNILKNSIEHSEIGSKIHINYEENKLYSKIEIRDFGKGIEPKDMPHIFDRFYKGKNSFSDSIGIGLALAKSIIERNNGYIEVESIVNKGTLFIIKYIK